MPHVPTAVLALVIGLALTACATTSRSTGAPPAADRGEGLLTGATDIPPALAAAKDGPYVLAQPAACATIEIDISALDVELGPDLDASDAEGDPNVVERAMTGAIRGAIPYRWALRWMIGAERKERAFQEAVLAGTARRGFLKGVARAMGCPGR
ncbi:MAG: hypothetical protein ACK41C_00305 [Phenylobacterium sp.]|jgi:hypothetical protein|uniref:hypothetical protein n=1 Tax=Phenylobacterium sp. TaxID=1871053 RepID=UPI00391AD73F